MSPRLRQVSVEACAAVLVALVFVLAGQWSASPGDDPSPAEPACREPFPAGAPRVLLVQGAGDRCFDGLYVRELDPVRGCYYQQTSGESQIIAATDEGYAIVGILHSLPTAAYVHQPPSIAGHWDALAGKEPGPFVCEWSQTVTVGGETPGTVALAWEVRGAGSADYNGVYRHAEIALNAHLVFRLDDTHWLWWMADTTRFWCLSEYPGCPELTYRGTAGVELPAAKWQVGHGAVPAPSVMAAEP